MDHGPGRLELAIIAAIALASSLAEPRSATAGIIATDSYTIGAGGYTAGTAANPVPLHNQGSTLPTSVGFLAGSIYNGGSGTNNFDVYQGGLAATDPANAGHISFDGVNTDNLVRSNARSLVATASIPTLSTYWFSINVSQDGTSTTSLPGGATNGYALAGFGNTVPPLFGPTAGNLEGLFFGFTHEPGDPAGANADLAIRYRNGTSSTADSVLISNAAANFTYTIIASLTVNVGGPNDYLSYWVNPTNTSSIAGLDSSSLVHTDYTNGGGVTTLAFQNTADLVRLTYSAQNWNGDTGSASFGDPTIGASLADVVPAAVPEPASVVLVVLGLAGGLVASRRRRASV